MKRIAILSDPEPAQILASAREDAE